MAINLNAVGRVLGPVTCEYTEDDAILYALGIGVEPSELRFLYEKDLRVLPTFAVVAARRARLNLLEVLNADLRKLLHGENRIELYRPLPPRAKLTVTSRIPAIYDKGKGALAIVEMEAKDETGDPLFRNVAGLFVRGEGGFGGDRGPSGAKNDPPDGPPDAVVALQTHENQAQIYRLSGDKNPLHVDPEFARLAGFDRPILHGLCTYGHVGRAVLRAFCGNDPSRLRSLEVRFSGVVYPGETLTTEMWRNGNRRVILQARVGEDRIVISNAAAEIT